MLRVLLVAPDFAASALPSLRPLVNSSAPIDPEAYRALKHRFASIEPEETKTISTVMGGMAVTNDPDIASQMRTFQASCRRLRVSLSARYLTKFIVYYMLTAPRVHRFARVAYERLGRRNPLPVPTTLEERRGGRPPYYERRLSNGQAAVGLSQLRGLQANLKHRELVANAYEKCFSRCGFPLPRVPAKATPAYVRYPIWADDRATVSHAHARHAVVGMWFTSVLEEAEPPEAVGYVEVRARAPNRLHDI
jgi:hypothetical protein